jgi:pimeloyl-ACP methyl ester carboxylesterase
MKRTDTHFISNGARCAAWFWEPDGPGPHACVLLCHGFGAIKEARLDAYGDCFARAGLAVLAFDYRHFGGSEGEPRHVATVEGQLEDIAAALSHLRSLPQIDPARIALWGSSFGGGHVLTTAARDPQVAAVVSQCPFLDGRDKLGEEMGYGLRLVPRALLDLVRRGLGGSPVYVPIVGPAGSMAPMHGPGDEEGYLALLPPGAPWDNRINAGFVLSAGFYRPIESAPRVRCPVLFAICDGDTVVSPALPVRAAEIVPGGGRALHYPCGHFGIYLGELFEQASRDQVSFLTEHLGPAGAPHPAPAAS